MNTITIGIAEDQQLFRKGMVLLLNSFKNVKVIHEAENGDGLMEMIPEEVPSVIILNHNLPEVDGIKDSLTIRTSYPDVKIIILSSRDGIDSEVILALENGANGYLTKNDGQKEIEKAIYGVIQNNYYINDRVSKMLINNMMVVGKIKPSFVSNVVQFTPEEIRIIEMISQEYTTQQIADAIHKSTRTVEKYRTKMLLKVGAHNSVGLVMYAIKNNIIII